MSQPRPSAVPSMTRLAPSPSADFSSQAPLWLWQGWRDEPQARCQPHLGSPSAPPSHYEQSLRQGGHSNFFGSTFEEPCGVTTQLTTHYKAAMHHLAQVSREVTPSSDKEASFEDTTHHAKDGIRSSNKRRKQHPLGTMIMASRDEDRGWEVGSSGMGHISATTRNSRRSARMPTDYFKRLLEEACPNHAYPVRHKLKDCFIMQSFMTLGSLTWGTKPDE
jgi:hypothetical protein